MSLVWGGALRWNRKGSLGSPWVAFPGVWNPSGGSGRNHSPSPQAPPESFRGTDHRDGDPLLAGSPQCSAVGIRSLEQAGLGRRPAFVPGDRSPLPPFTGHGPVNPGSGSGTPQHTREGARPAQVPGPRVKSVKLSRTSVKTQASCPLPGERPRHSASSGFRTHF